MTEYGKDGSNIHADCLRNSYRTSPDNIPDIPGSIATRIDGEKSPSFAS